jgi:hypothetical protein
VSDIEPPVDPLPDYVDPIPDDLPRPAPNSAVPIYSGHVAVGARALSGEGTVEVRWVPEAAVICHVEFDPQKDPHVVEDLFRINEEIEVEVGSAGTIHGRFRGGSWHPERPWVELEVYGSHVVGQGDQAVELRFELVNLDDVHGEPVRYGEHGWGADRIQLKSRRWIVDLDGARGRDVYDELNRTGGYAVTHNGRAVRCDAGSVTPEDAEALFTTLQYTLSFAERRWVTPIRGRALRGDGQLAWELWGLWNTNPWARPLTWFGRGTPAALSAVFEAIDDSWADQYWERLLRTSIHYYLDAGRGLVHRGVVMGGALLELVGWHVVVEDRALLSARGYDRLETHDRLRLLLRLMSLPLDIPDELPALKRYADRSWDLATAITEIRHSVVHAKRHQQVWELEPDVWVDVAQLNNHLCDLAMLFLLSYNGEYVNPLTARYAADRGPVPWAQQTSRISDGGTP